MEYNRFNLDVEFIRNIRPETPGSRSYPYFTAMIPKVPPVRLVKSST
ncbi:hypothetical protein TUN199_10737 [Pyrenophora tritici-repentis]|nr:hypothetical protein A1F99_088810 [Pyrenophora tritici-repentis]KAI0571628.1 hypothetical protein Alg130_10809 [Pyrenophora tritici-repentis]KAI0604996.1 hypothetical protein TUN205_10754 [Pyrenophora tritici-repentis]KAI0617268.1 hypothetical protein TUN199_10737 [Pyrenophora tritici-repentis]